MDRKILLGSNNAKKRKELAEMLEGMDFQILIPSDLGDYPSPVEDGETFEANAAIKAHHFSRLTGLPTLADDSGLAVDALQGAPGIHSARYGGEDATDQDNCTKLLAALKEVADPDRTARFVCAVVVVSEGKLLGSAQGTCEGTILREKRGHGGFGYDPLFFYTPQGLTFAELPQDLKNKVSHRANALKGILLTLKKL